MQDVIKQESNNKVILPLSDDKIIKPMLARDVNEAKLKFPVVVSNKVDGSFAFIQNGKLLARSLKQHENKHVTQQYSNPEFEGLRGELIAGFNPVAEDLCRNTSSALRTVAGEPETSLWCFDYVTPETKDLGYEQRSTLLYLKVIELQAKGYDFIKFIPCQVAHSLQEYEEFKLESLEKGFEGCVVRDPLAKHKEGRSSAVKPELWRFKPWASAEIMVTQLVEEMKNCNEAKKNELGYTERSSHQAGKEGKGTLGAIVGTLVTPVLDCYGEVITEVGTEVTISTGCLKADDCWYYWTNPSELLGKIVEFEYFSYGLKEKPRFAQFKRVRSEVDMS